MPSFFVLFFQNLGQNLSTTIIPHIMLCDDASLVVLCCFMLRILYFYAKTATQEVVQGVIQGIVRGLFRGGSRVYPRILIGDV